MKLPAVVLDLRKLLPAPTGSRGRLARLLPLVLALSPLLALGGDRGHFSRSGFGHNWEWAKNLALAENLPPESDGTPADFGATSNREYARIVAGTPAARSEFDVYVHEGKLSYVKEPCVAGDTRDPFFLHLLPADENDLPEWRQPYGFENKDFDFGKHGGVFDGKCLATVPLPEYDIDGFRTGQYVPGEEPSWQVDFGAMYDREYARIVAGAPAASAEFDVYLHEGKLSYVKEPCVKGDTQAPFFLHLLPADENDLPGGSRLHGFENRDFDFGEHGGVFDGKCLATVPLPEYDIDGFRTGQVVPGEGRFWQVAFGAMYSREYARIVAGAPAASAEFDVYLHEGKLSYVKEPCVKGDTRAPFFLHLLPADEDDLPEWNKPHGFENKDFNFGAHGGVFDGKCLATIPLPEYDIDGFRTGQVVPGEGRAWQAAFGAMYSREYARIVAGAPAASAEFDVYLHEGKLSYVKEPCVKGDTRAPFFLHLLPTDENDLPEWNKPHGFENRDFDFGQHGGVFDGKCLATVPLPEYDIDSFRTGQYVPGEGRSWKVDNGMSLGPQLKLILKAILYRLN